MANEPVAREAKRSQIIYLKRCAVCGMVYPETEVNIAAVLDGNRVYICKRCYDRLAEPDKPELLLEEDLRG